MKHKKLFVNTNIYNIHNSIVIIFKAIYLFIWETESAGGGAEGEGFFAEHGTQCRAQSHDS